MTGFGGMAHALAAATAPNPYHEVPIGAALVYREQLISTARNAVIEQQNPLAHAEMRVIEQASSRLGVADWQQTILFVTLEPCPMCMGAILQARIGQVVFGAYNLKWGSTGTVLDFLSHYEVAAPCQVYGGIREAECSELLQRFFEGLRV